MVNFQESLNPLLDAFEKIYEASAESCLEPAKFADCRAEVDATCQFFECTEQPAILLALLLRQHYQNDDPSVRDLLDHTGLKPSAAVHVHRLLEPFVAKDWIKPKQDIRYFPYTNYKLHNRFVHCVTTADWSHLCPKPIETSLDLLERFARSLNDRRSSDITYNKFLESTTALLEEHEQLPIAAFIQHAELGSLETLCFLSMCNRHYRGNESFDFDALIDDISPSLEEQFRFRQQIKARKGVFFERELIDLAPSDGIIFTSSEYRLTEAAIRSFHPDPVVAVRQLGSAMLDTYEPEKIPTKNLFYGEQEKEQMDRLFNLLSPANFESFENRMAERKMKGGLTILLYGAPGTGKTESVMQLARHSGRMVLAADASTIRSKWVGETEKNIKRLFQDYKKAIDLYEAVPILLFNEADAILGRRRAVVDRVEQMENALQNILLQELENFEGIFIATTNLEENLDPAFDRRILYKVRFSPPTDALRQAIWRDKLPELTDELLESVNKQYKLTGGQIDNVAKKIEVSRLLDPGTPISLTYLSALAEEEISLRTGQHRRPVGFTRNTIES